MTTPSDLRRDAIVRRALEMMAEKRAMAERIEALRQAEQRAYNAFERSIGYDDQPTERLEAQWLGAREDLRAALEQARAAQEQS